MNGTLSGTQPSVIKVLKLATGFSAISILSENGVDIQPPKFASNKIV